MNTVFIILFILFILSIYSNKILYGAQSCELFDKQKLTGIYKYNKIYSNLKSIILSILQINTIDSIKNTNNTINESKINIPNLKELLIQKLESMKNINDIETFYYYIKNNSISIEKQFTFFNKHCKIYNFILQNYNLIILNKIFKKKYRTIINNFKSDITNLSNNDKLAFLKFYVNKNTIEIQNGKIFMSTGATKYNETDNKLTLQSYSEYDAYNSSAYMASQYKVGMLLYNHQDPNNSQNVIYNEQRTRADIATSIWFRTRMYIDIRVGFATKNRDLYGLDMNYIAPTKKINFFEDYYTFNGNLSITSHNFINSSETKILYKFSYSGNKDQNLASTQDNPYIYPNKNKYILIYQYIPITQSGKTCDNNKCYGRPILNQEESSTHKGGYNDGFHGVWAGDPLKSHDASYRQRKMKLYWINTHDDTLFYHFNIYEDSAKAPGREQYGKKTLNLLTITEYKNSMIELSEELFINKQF